MREDEKRNYFITHIKELNTKNDEYENKAYEKIINNLFIKNLWGKEKAMGLDEYDSEKNSKLTLIPGHIYAFRYISSTNTTYDDGNIKFEFNDTLPIILCLNNTKTTVSGINLNLCNYALRTLILNDVFNLDPSFFAYEASEQSHRGQIPISKNITRFFMNKENQTKFLNNIVQKYKIKNYSLIFRTYSTKNIKTIRFIEAWQWQYIPFINYKQNIKQNVLQLIQHITGIDKVKI